MNHETNTPKNTPPSDIEENADTTPHADIFKEQIVKDDRSLSIEVQQNDDGWGLQIISSAENLTDYEDSFNSKEAAVNEAHEAIAECGFDSFFW